jgi:phosphoglucosamine mutase
MCRVMVEGPSESVTERYCQEIADAVKKVLG